MPKLSAGEIPGYAEALAGEVLVREVSYLGTEWDVCGIAVNAMTPAMLCELSAMNSPFICGGFPTIESVAHLLTVCSRTAKQRASRFRSWLFNRRVRRNILKRGWTFEDCVADIDQYVDAMFQDAPSGGTASTPYASSAAWLEYTMACAPWRWNREQTMSTPLPIIYQQIRCHDRSRGATLSNQSDWLRARYLDGLNSKS